MSEVPLMNATILLCYFSIVNLLIHNPFQNEVILPGFERFLLIVLE